MNTKVFRFALLAAKFVIIALIFILVLGACKNTGNGPDNQGSTSDEGSSPVEDSSSDEVSLTVVNATDVEICVVSAINTESGEKFENILEEILDPGGKFTISGFEPLIADLEAFDCSENLVYKSFDVPLTGKYSWEITGFEIADYELPAPPSTSLDQTWLVMLYVDADDEALEWQLLQKLNEAELVGSSDQVQIVAQVDRFEGGYEGDGGWATTKRFYITEDDDLTTITSEELMDIGEVNMADPVTLADFVVEAVDYYPADKYVLILSDHGLGWPGGMSDQSAPEDWISPFELESVLKFVQENTDLEQFELIGFETCLMSSLEIYTAIAPYARYVVASEELSYGWAYDKFLNALAENPGMGGADLAASVVENYMDNDLLAENYPEYYWENLKQNITLSAFDLAAIPDLLSAFDNFLIAASKIDQTSVAQARILCPVL